MRVSIRGSRRSCGIRYLEKVMADLNGSKLPPYATYFSNVSNVVVER